MQYTKLTNGGLRGLMNLPKNGIINHKLAEVSQNPVPPKSVEGFVYCLM
jgi:hypothetical protein